MSKWDKFDSVKQGLYSYPCMIDHAAMINGELHYKVHIVTHYEPIKHIDVGEAEVSIEPVDPDIPFISEFVEPCGSYTQEFFKCPYCARDFKDRRSCYRHINERKEKEKSLPPTCTVRKDDEPMVNGKWENASLKPILNLVEMVQRCESCDRCKNTEQEEPTPEN